jgi:hypothetical protein
MTRGIAFLAACLLCGLSVTYAQGVQTGAVHGRVRDEQGLPVPGATVTISSAVLQAPRSATTDADGAYAIAALPAGDYTLTFELPNFTTVSHQTGVPLGLAVEHDVVIRVAGLAEAVHVVGEISAPVVSPSVGANFEQLEVEALATPRTIQGIAQLAPAVTENAPNANQLVINGAFAFDNAFMINGVDINDNVFATPQSLFIEDAIQETQVITSGIPAEYGRFTGGVVNAITKSGGDNLSGTFRMNLSNPSWSEETPFERQSGITRPEDLQATYEGTVGGPIRQRGVWFFGAGRYANVRASRTLPQTAIQIDQAEQNQRGELKVTGTVHTHTIQGGFLRNARTTSNDSGILDLIIDAASLVSRERPNSYVFATWRGAPLGMLLGEMQFSERRSAFRGGGSSDNITDSPFVSIEPLGIYAAPYFDDKDPEERNNRQFTGNVTRFWNRAGRHDTKIGYEFFRSQRVGGGSQSSTNYVLWSDYAKAADGRPLRDSGGRLIPVFVPGVSALDYYPAVRGATLNNDSHSAYARDHWSLNDRWTVDVGARFERVRAVSSGDIVSVENARVVPRLAVSHDVKGNGSHVVHLTYGQYSGRYNEAQIAGNSPVGNAPEIYTTYVGPAGQGHDFAPGFNVANYPVARDTFVSIPTGNVFMAPNLKSALVHETTASYGATLLNGRAFAEAAYIARRTTDMIDDFFTVADGTTHVVAYGVDVGTFQNRVFRNADAARREYQAAVFQTRLRPMRRWTATAHYTLQLRNHGNFEGEAVNEPGAASLIGDYPEALAANRHYPEGRLQNFQRHRLRLWSIHDVPAGRAGDLSVSGMWRVDSARVYSLQASRQRLTASQRALLSAAGYTGSPASGSHSVYFAERGSEKFRGYGVFDLNLRYSVPLARSVRPWLKLDVFNLFNNMKLISWNTTVQQDPASPVDTLGLATGYVKGSEFGQMESNANFPAPFNGATGGRTILLAAGVNF